MGIEPTLSAWKAEVLPLNYTRRVSTLWPTHFREPPTVVEGGGFEPPKAEPSDLQSDPFGRSGTPPEPEGRILMKQLALVNSSQPPHLYENAPY